MGALFNPAGLVKDAIGSIGPALVLVAGIFSSIGVAKTVLKENDEGVKGYLANVAGGLGFAVVIGAVTKKAEYFKLGVIAAIATPLIRVALDFLKGRQLPFGITLGFEDYVVVRPGMSDFLMLQPGPPRLGDWLTTRPAMPSMAGGMGSIVTGDTIRRYGDE